ncbi:MAG: hypothetical protein U9R55_06535 [Pseudomonadota bacterium]|jgi:hypothetical protein|uniref:hypothetical protein n=1 Tax=Curvibacter delicatus TaxID=80879 RepID=UPI000832F580|nr:hypothetical protein [Curvibacter delicatus]MEA3394267.1 hypothetical protein [Pseudomonadota bacterium]HJV03542.1 hypothetical protein [Burkholderiaceae bacterium]
MTHPQAHELDRHLSELALHYQSEQAPAGAVERVLARLAGRSRMLNDADLEWLAAAGPGFPPPQDPH